MNPDNPYAAPQPETAVPSALPQTQPAGRLYAELDDETLNQLAAWAKTILNADAVWMIYLSFGLPVILAHNYLLQAELWKYIFPLITLLMGATRFFFLRGGKPRERKFLLAADLWLMFVCLGTALWLGLVVFVDSQKYSGYVLGIIILLLLTRPLNASLVTLHQAQRLFGPEQFVLNELDREAFLRKCIGPPTTSQDDAG